MRGIKISLFRLSVSFYAEYCQYLKSMGKLVWNVLIFTTAFCYNLYPVLCSNLYEHFVLSTQSAFDCSLLKYTCLLAAMRQMISIRKKMLLSSIQISTNWLHLQRLNQNSVKTSKIHRFAKKSLRLLAVNYFYKMHHFKSLTGF